MALRGAVQQRVQVSVSVAQSAIGFEISGLPANHMRAYVMGAYQRCEEREKVNGRYVYEYNRADGGGKVFCWHAEGGLWGFNQKETSIGLRAAAKMTRRHTARSLRASADNGISSLWFLNCFTRRLNSPTYAGKTDDPCA